MSSYIQQTLTEDEKAAAFFAFHWMKKVAVFLRAFGVAFLLFILIISLSADNAGDSLSLLTALIVSVAAFVLFAGFGYLNIRLTEMGVTNKRVILRTGVVMTHTEELRTEKIESVELRQSVLGRICGYSDLYLSGTGNGYIRFQYLANPYQAKKEIEKSLNKRK